MAARSVLNVVWPARKGARVEFELPDIGRANELPAAIAGINRQVAEGWLSLEEGALTVGLLEIQRKPSKHANSRPASRQSRKG